MIGLMKTWAKLGVSLYQFLGDRFAVTGAPTSNGFPTSSPLPRITAGYLSRLPSRQANLLIPLNLILCRALRGFFLFHERTELLRAVMQWNRTDPEGCRGNRAGMGGALLRLALHSDALRAEPRTWLIAAWWWLCGKRLRARSRMAPLLGLSPRAYRVWLSCGERKAKAGSVSRVVLGDAFENAPSIVALVTAGEGQEATLASLGREGIAAQLVTGSGLGLPEAVATEDDTPIWIMPLAAGDVLAPGAGAVYRAVAGQDSGNGRDTLVFYADDDLIGARGQRTAPHFKPDWNSELFRHFDYLTGASILRATRDDLKGLPDDAWPAALTARLIEHCAAQGTAPHHLRQVLHHRCTRPSPQRPGKGAGYQAAGPAASLPTVSVIIPTRNRLDLLRPCLQGLASTDYPALEIVVIDNDSDDPETLDYLAALDREQVRVIDCPGPFNFAAMNNRAAAEVQSELLCFLNNDIEICDPDWLANLARQAVRDDVGAVGARLLYPDGRIQHAGVVIGLGGGAGHAHRLLWPEEEGYFHRHNLPQFVSAVTAACLVVRRERFLAVGGFDAVNFAVAFNDVDLCMKLNAKGWQSFYEPRATLIHHESVSRGLDRDPVGSVRLARELAALKARWGTGGALSDGASEKVDAEGEAVDPFHHPCLSPFSERFVVRI